MMSLFLTSFAGLFAGNPSLLKPSASEIPTASDGPNNSTGYPALDAFLGGAGKAYNAVVPEGLRNRASRLAGDASDYWDELMFPARVDSVLADHNSTRRFEGPERQRIWEAALDHLDEEGIDYPRDEVGTYEDYLHFLSEHGVGFPKRIQSLKTAFTLAANNARLGDPEREKEIGSERPIAVVIGPKTDWNGAFEARCFPMLDCLIENGSFDVLYVECGSDEEAAQALRQIRQQSGRRIHTAVIAGHGSRQTLQLGDGGTSDENHLDVQDLEEDGLFHDLNDMLEPDGQIILWSCSNGAPLPSSQAEDEDDRWSRMRMFDPFGRDRRTGDPRPKPDPKPVSEAERYNMAEAVSHRVPGREVLAVKVPSNIRSVYFNPFTLSARVGWHDKGQGFIAQTSLEEYQTRLLESVAKATIRTALDAAAGGMAVFPSDPGCDPGNQSCRS
jgi:hypothetical protein